MVIDRVKLKKKTIFHL